MFDNIPKITTAADLENITPRQRRIARVTPPERVAEIEARREREARRQAAAAPYIDAGGVAWSSEDASRALVFFNVESGPAKGSALGYFDADTGELVSKKAAVSNEQFADTIKTRIGATS